MKRFALFRHTCVKEGEMAIRARQTLNLLAVVAFILVLLKFATG